MALDAMGLPLPPTLVFMVVAVAVELMVCFDLEFLGFENGILILRLGNSNGNLFGWLGLGIGIKCVGRTLYRSERESSKVF